MASRNSSTAEVRGDRNLISLKRAAALVDVDRKTIRQWIDAGLLNGYRLNGNMWRVSSHEVLALAHPVVLDSSDGVA